MDGRRVGPFCTRPCAFGWVIRNDERALNYLEFDAIGEGPELVTDGGFEHENPTGVVCHDCALRTRWHPAPSDEQHKHELATDHNVEYVDAGEIRQSVNYDGEIVAVHDEQATLVTDGGTNIPPWIDPNTEYVCCHFCGLEWDPRKVDGFDLSADDEYYPNMVPVCPEHAAGGCR